MENFESRIKILKLSSNVELPVVEVNIFLPVLCVILYGEQYWSSLNLFELKRIPSFFYSLNNNNNLQGVWFEELPKLAQKEGKKEREGEREWERDGKKEDLVTMVLTYSIAYWNPKAFSILFLALNFLWIFVKICRSSSFYLLREILITSCVHTLYFVLRQFTRKKIILWVTFYYSNFSFTTTTSTTATTNSTTVMIL